MEERLVGITMSGMAGNSPFPLYSLEQAANFLGMSNWKGAMNPSSRMSVAYIEPKALKRWVDEVFGDIELAQAITETIEISSNYMSQVRSIRKILQHRVRQHEAALQETEE